MPIGYFADTFENHTIPNEWYTNAFLEIAREDLGVDNVTISIQNKRSIRYEIPTGFLTRESLLQSNPFSNQLVIIELDGYSLTKFLQKIIEDDNFQSGRDSILISLSIEGELDNIKTNRKYRIIMSDYLHSYLSSIYNIKNQVIYKDPVTISIRLIDYVIGKTISNKRISYK